MDYRSLMKKSFSEMRQYSSQTVMATRSLTSFGRYTSASLSGLD